MGKYHEAIEKFDKAIYINPFYALAFNGKGSCLEKIERYQEAIECFDKAIQINANDSFAFNNKGICFFKMNIMKQSIATIRPLELIQIFWLQLKIERLF